MTSPRSLPAAQLLPPLPEDCLNFADTSQLGEAETQDDWQLRAMKALEFGLSLPAKGYNLYVLGEAGTGRVTAIKRLLSGLSERQSLPSDWCYVANFDQADSPMALALPAGQAPSFARRIRDLIEELKETIPLAFDSEGFERARSEITDSHDVENEANFNALREKAKSRGLAVKRASSGFSLVPLKEDGDMMQEDEFNRLPEPEQKAIKQKQEQAWVHVSTFLRQVRVFEKDVKERVKALEEDTVRKLLDQALAELRTEFADHARILDYLSAMQCHIVANWESFKPPSTTPPGPRALMGMMQERSAKPENPLAIYDVNVFVTHPECQRAPVVCEHNPTYYNLFGAVEYRSQMGTLVTDASMIKPGALHRANGGYLILQAQDLFRDYITWDSLKRALRNEELRIEELGKQFSLIATAGVRPEPIPLKVKVILVGTHALYYLLSRWDPDFTRFFKVKSDFELEMPRTPATLKSLAVLVAEECRKKNLPHFTRAGVAGLANALSRLAGHQAKMSARFMDVADLVAEAGHWAILAGRDVVDADCLDKALDERIYRSSCVEQKINELIAEGTLHIDLYGTKVGQINGLAVLDLGDYRFGKPSRITVQTYLGKQGLINIEREAKLSGQIHDKGLMILRGFFLGRYGQFIVPTFGASITFEQEYSMIDGDSASSTELYALLSSLSGCPIRQGIAVTGSVSQMGEVQPIGGVNEKIEGFFKVCEVHGLTGDQGVMIPAANAKHLNLGRRVRAAVSEGLFSVWQVATIDQGIELLTGVTAGEPDEAGNYPPETVNRRVMDRLREYEERLRVLQRDGGERERGAESIAPVDEVPKPYPTLPGDRGPLSPA